jgi:hypothetical protein
MSTPTVNRVLQFLKTSCLPS